MRKNTFFWLTTTLYDVLGWVLGQGHTVKVLGPGELVEMVREESEMMRGIYERYR
ncbi:hypothetical protein FACS1894163_03960 [Spirochaetia bacterium]|nr:hypothetical protein FACS1894163_03960 [Spirochaetia bacterium]